MSVVVHVATKGHVRACDPAVARRCVDVCGLCYHQIRSVLLPEAIMSTVLCYSKSHVYISVAHAAGKGHEGVTSPCCALGLYCWP